MLRITFTSLVVLLLICFTIPQSVNGQGIGFGTGSGVGGAGGGGFSGGGIRGGGGGAASVLGNGQAGEGGGISGVLSDRGESTVGGTGFLGRNNNNNQGFGASQGANAGAQGFGAGNFGNAGNFGGRGTGGAFGGGGRGAGQNQQPAQRQSTRVIRTRISIPKDFGYTGVPSTEVQSGLNSRFQRVSQLRTTMSRRGATRISTSGLRGANISVTTNDRQVLLTGRVASERDKKIAEKMAKMEPGVGSVVNELVIAP